MLAAEHHGFHGAGVHADLARKHRAQQTGAFDVSLFPAEIVGRDTGHAVLALLRGGQLHFAGHHEHGWHETGWHGVISHGHAPGDLYVDQLIDCALGVSQRLRQVLRNRRPLGARQRIGDAQFGQRPVQACHVLFEPERSSGVTGQHLVHTVAKYEASVQHTDPSITQRGELPVEVAEGVGQIGRCAPVRSIHQKIIGGSASDAQASAAQP
ncbi:hypothetical protein D9M68_664060 [compost metagenome]